MKGELRSASESSRYSGETFKSALHFRLFEIFMLLKSIIFIFQTRLHSSRMHTTRSLTVSPSMHCSEGVPSPERCLVWGVSDPRGVPGPRGHLLPGGVWSWGVSGPGGCLFQGGAWSQGRCLLLGG